MDWVWVWVCGRGAELSVRDVGCPRSDGRVGTCVLIEMRVVRHDSRERQAGRMVQVEGASNLGRSEV